MESIMFGLNVSVIGMAVTFVGLIALIGLIHLNRIIAESINKMTSKPNEDLADKMEDPKTNVKVESQKAATLQAVSSDNNSVIAAITAAVSVIMEGKPFKVKSVKMAQASQNTNAWDMVAIQEQNNNF